MAYGTGTLLDAIEMGGLGAAVIGMFALARFQSFYRSHPPRPQPKLHGLVASKKQTLQQ